METNQEKPQGEKALYTPEEVEAAKTVRVELVKSNDDNLLGIFVAGRINMWAELQSDLTTLRTKLEAMEVENAMLTNGRTLLTDIYKDLQLVIGRLEKERNELKEKADKWDEYQEFIKSRSIELKGKRYLDATPKDSLEKDIQEYKAIELKNLKNPE